MSIRNVIERFSFVNPLTRSLVHSFTRSTSICCFTRPGQHVHSIRCSVMTSTLCTLLSPCVRLTALTLTCVHRRWCTEAHLWTMHETALRLCDAVSAFQFRLQACCGNMGNMIHCCCQMSADAPRGVTGTVFRHGTKSRRRRGLSFVFNSGTRHVLQLKAFWQLSLQPNHLFLYRTAVSALQQTTFASHLPYTILYPITFPKRLP